MKLMDMTWGDVKPGGTAVVPIGSVEQHGPHMPLGADTFIAEAVSNEIASKLNAVVAPSVAPGVSSEHMDFPGTLSLSQKSFKNQLTDVCRSLRKSGFRRIILVNGHGGNRRALSSIRLRGVRHLDIVGQIKGYDHAGEIETSLMLCLHPDKVRVKKIRMHDFRFPGKKSWRTIDYSKSGVLGDPTKASKQKGRAYFRQIVSQLMGELKNER